MSIHTCCAMWFFSSSISTTAKTIQPAPYTSILSRDFCYSILYPVRQHLYSRTKTENSNTHIHSRARPRSFYNVASRFSIGTDTHTHALIQRRTLVTSDKTIGDGKKVFYPENFARNFLFAFYFVVCVKWVCASLLIDNASNEWTPFNIERVHQQIHWIEETTMMTTTTTTTTMIMLCMSYKLAGF